MIKLIKIHFRVTEIDDSRRSKYAIFIEPCIVHYKYRWRNYRRGKIMYNSNKK